MVFLAPGDELFSDTYKYKLVDGCLYEVVGKVSWRAWTETWPGKPGLGVETMGGVSVGRGCLNS